MGFSATAGHLILVVSIVSAGAVGLVTLWDTTADVDDASRTREAAVVKKAHSSIDLTSGPTCQQGQGRYSFTLQNTGDVPLDRDLAVFVVSGSVRNDDIISIQVQEATSSAVWMPDEHLVVELSVSPCPNNNPPPLWVVTEYGATARS